LPLAGRKINGKWASAAAAVYPADFIKACAYAIAASMYLSKSGRFKMLHLFSGPSNRSDGFGFHLSKLGWDVEEVDILNYELGLSSHADSDLRSDALWTRLLSRIKGGEFQFVWFGTPCTTWSAVRGVGKGPRALRSEAEPYGLKGPSPPFTEEEKTQLKEGTCYVLRTFLTARAISAVGGGFCIENPEPRESHASIFKLKEFQALVDVTGCQIVDLDQCRFGGDSTKPTRLAYHVPVSPGPGPHKPASA